MSGFSTLGTAVSGLRAAQAGLYVTGHNVANVTTTGYSRQQALQRDFLFNTLGYNHTGPMQVGLGTDVQCIRQLRDKFMDKTYRDYNTKEAFYQVKYGAGLEVEAILNELEGQYKFQSILADLYDSIQELSKDPAAMDTRANFIASCIAFIEKANDTYDTMFDYQRTLNEQVKEDVVRINQLANLIDQYNNEISSAEAAGDNANDFRDKRNLALDELSGLVNIIYKEQPNGAVDVLIEGEELVANGLVRQLGLRYTSKSCDFVEPVFTNKTEILDYDPSGRTNARPLFNLNATVTASKGNDNGELKALLVARGTQPADFTWGLSKGDPLYPGSAMDPQYNAATPPVAQNPLWSSYNEFNRHALIPNAMIQLDTLVHGVVSFINDSLAGKNEDTNEWAYSPHPPNDQGVEIFSRKYEQYQNSAVKYGDIANGYTEEDAADVYSLYRIGNIVINPEVLNPGGYYKIATALTIGGEDTGMSDNTAIKSLLDMWDSGVWKHYDDGPPPKWDLKHLSTDGGEPLSVANYYRHIVTETAEETSDAKQAVDNQHELMIQIGYFRDAMMGVSMDEELTNMMKYQHAYNASARMVNVIDAMLDKLINGTGRAGM